MIFASILALAPFAAQNPIDPTLDPQSMAQANQGNPNYVAGSVYGGVQNAGSLDSDDFNRATLGSGWTQNGSGTFAITNNTLTSAPSTNDWIQRVGTNAPYQDQTTEFDLLPITSGLSYTAAVMGVGADMLYTKVQGSSSYTNIGFYHGFNSSGGSYGGFVGITAVSGGHVRIYLTNAGDTMNVDIDEFHDGVYEYHYEASGIIATLGGSLGTGVGIGGYNASLDNWQLGDGPSNPVYAITGLAGGGTATFTITNATAGAGVLIGYSLAGPGPTNTPFGPVDMSPPISQLPTLTADPSGVASLSSGIPGRASGFTLYTQAVDLTAGVLSNSLAELIL
jgi:hypothetical protein